MAAFRVNIPTLFVSGGPMKAGTDAAGNALDLTSVFEGVGAYQAGKIDELKITRNRTIRLSYMWILFRYVYSKLYELFGRRFRYLPYQVTVRS